MSLSIREESPQIIRHSGASGHRLAPSSAKITGFSFTGADFLRLLRRRKWLIILSLGIFILTAGVGTFLWLQFAPFYSATALLVVNPPKTTDINPERTLLVKEMMDRLMQTRAQSAKTEQVFLLAIDDIRQTKWYNQVTSGDKDIIQELFDEVSVSVVPGTVFLRVSMTGLDTSDITEIVNAIANAAVSEASMDSSQDLSKTIKRLATLRGKQESKRNKSMEKIQTLLQRGIGGEAVEDQHTLMYKQQYLVQMMARIRPMYAQAKDSWDTIREKADVELANEPEVQQMLEYDYKFRELEIRLLGLEFQLRSAERKFHERHNSIKRLKIAVEETEKQLEEKTKIIIAKNIAALKGARQSQFQGLEAQFEILFDQIEENSEELKVLETLLTRLKEAEDTRDHAVKTIDKLDERLMDLRLLKDGEPPLVLQRRALLPRKPSMPKYIIMMPLGVFLGLAFGLGLALLLEFMDTSIKAPSDVSRRVDLPLLGMIPHLDDVEEDIEDLRVAFLTSPDTIICESFRQIRTTLMFSGPAEQRKSILVTSPMPEDGRTSVSLNLAHAIVSGGKRVLVVDANFRQPMIRKLFPMCPEGGLSSALVGQADWRELVHEIEPNLDVMASGPIPPNPAELLGSDQMRQKIAEFCEDYDQVIFDGSPCLVVSDSAVLSTMVDGTILTVRAGVNTYGIVQRSKDSLIKLGTHIFGVVLNGVRVTTGGYLRKSYETYYEYRETPKLPAGVVAGTEGEDSPQE